MRCIFLHTHIYLYRKLPKLLFPVKLIYDPSFMVSCSFSSFMLCFHLGEYKRISRTDNRSFEFYAFQADTLKFQFLSLFAKGYKMKYKDSNTHTTTSYSSSRLPAAHIKLQFKLCIQIKRTGIKNVCLLFETQANIRRLCYFGSFHETIVKHAVQLFQEANVRTHTKSFHSAAYIFEK